MLGRKGKCPKCQHVFVMEEPPTVDLEEAAPAAEAPAATMPTAPPAATAPPQNTFTGAPSGFPGLSIEEPVASLKPTISRRKKSKIPGFLIPLAVVLAVGGGGAAAYFAMENSGSSAPKKLPTAGLVTSDQPATTFADSSAQPAVPVRDSNYTIDSIEFRPPTQRAPLVLKFIPAGSRIVIHLHPAALWKEGGSLAEEVRFSLGPVAEFAAAQIQALSGFAPSQIEQATISLIPTQRGMAPQVAGVFQLVEPMKRSDFLEKYGGQRDESNGIPIFLTDTKAYLLTDDSKTLAVSPMELGPEMARAASTPNPTSVGIEELVPQLDANRHFTILFEPVAVRIDADFLLPANARPLLNQFLDWLGDDVEAAAWSVHLGNENFYSQVWLRNSTVIQPARLARLIDQKLNELPDTFLNSIHSMVPRELGKRQVIGRFPAMIKAFVMASRTRTGSRFVEVVTPLPERAAPNLALASLLAWDESTRTDFSRKPGGASMAQTGGGGTVAGKLPDVLKNKIDIDWRRTPLQDAFSGIAEDLKITIDIDGDALKFSGYTKNMPQEFKGTQISGNAALQEILKKYDKMCIVIDQPKNRILVTTYPFAENQKLVPYVFP